MDERDFPAPPSAGEQLGAMTGATGRLTPDDPDDDFVPAETREVSDPETSRDLTAAAHRRREAKRRLAESDRGRPVRETRLGGDELGTTESDRF